jgi:uracil phosphoribosyltransferase
MDGITVVEHPLVQHKLTLIRDKARSTKSFRELLKEIGMLLCYEVTRDLPLTEVEIETPLARAKAKRIAGKKLVLAPVLRAGTTFVEGMLDLVPTARVAHAGLYREPETFVAVEYFFKAPADLRERLVIVVAPVRPRDPPGLAARRPPGLRACARPPPRRAHLDRRHRRGARRARLHPARPGGCGGSGVRDAVRGLLRQVAAVR